MVLGLYSGKRRCQNAYINHHLRYGFSTVLKYTSEGQDGLGEGLGK